MRILAALLAVGVGLTAAYAQQHHPRLGSSISGGANPVVPGSPVNGLQFNTNGTFGGISGITSDQANIGFATSSKLFIYGTTVGDCVKIGANNAISDSGSACGGSGAPGGSNTQVQFNTNGTFGGVSGAVSTNASSIAFSTNSLVINGQAISGVSGTTGTLATVTGSLTTNCIKADGSGNLIDSGTTCGGGGGGSTTSIAAGTNITTSGVATNTTVNVIATPSFTTVIATGNLTATTAQITGWLTAPGVNLFTATIANNLTGSTANFSSNLTAQIAQFPGFLSAGGASLSGLSIATATYSGNLTGTTANFSGNLTGTTAQFTGAVTGTSAVFQTVTVSNLTPTGPNCLQETGGVLQATNSACASGTLTSIAQGNNIVTSGTASNITVTATPTGASNTVQFNNAGVFGGDAGFQYAGGTSGIVTHTLGTVTTTNSKALSLVGAWSNSTTTFAAPLFVNVTTNTSSANTTSGFGVGSRLVDIQATSLSVLSISPSGAMSSAALQSGATQCLQASSGGLVFGTAVPCATQTSTPSIVAGTNITTSGTAANTTVNMVPTTPEFGLQYNHAGLLTADTGFTYGSSPGIATLTLGPGNLTTTNSRALSIIGTLSSGTVQFNPPLFMNITTNAFASGTKLVDVQASGISYLSVFASSGVTALGNLTGTTAAVIGWLTAPGVNMQTATLAGALIGTSGNFSTNLTGNIAQFAGFLSAGGASLSGLTIQTATFSSNLTGTTANFSSNLTANIAQFAGFMSAGGASLSGLTIVTATHTGNLTGTTANFSSNLTANIAQFAGFLTANGVAVTTSTFSQITGTSAFVTSVIGNAGTNSAGSISFLTNNVAQFGDGGTNANGWYNFSGEGRTTADSQGFISTGFVNLITISNLKAGRTYKLEAELPLKSATASTGGIALRLGGGAVATAVVYDGWIIDSSFNGTKGNAQATALSTTVANSSITGTTSHATLVGTISVSGAGTIILQASGFSTVTAASAVTVGRGATFIATDMP